MFLSSLALLPLSVLAQLSVKLDSTTSVTFGAFIDAYYAFDFNQPADRNRAFTTQPARHNEFNINLAFVEATVSSDRFRGRLALQTGTSVQFNYAGETTNRELAQVIQEAFIGVRLAEHLWVDGGIYFGHIGAESFISKNNILYTRLLASDYVPYYQTGIKLSWQIIPQLFMQAHVLNGWQNIAETNNDKAIAFYFLFAPNDKISFSYANFLGNEQPDGTPAQLRFYNNFIAATALSDNLKLNLLADIGIQGGAVWYILALFGQLKLSDAIALNARAEYFSDRNQTLVMTNTSDGFQTFGASLGVDVSISPQVIWRIEARGFSSQDAVFPSRNRALSTNGFIGTSLALSI